VVALLTQHVLDAGVTVRYGASVTGLHVQNNRLCGVQIGEEFMPADRVVVCTGGSSYPATGTTGDGWRWLPNAGHSLVPLRAALAPLYLHEAQTDWSGVALRGATLRARASREGKEYARWTGDLLFTHKGVSGPTALGVSRDIAERENTGAIEADLVPDTSFEDLRARLQAEARAQPRKTAAALVAPFLPARLVEPLLAAASVDPSTRGAYLPAKAVNKLASTLKGWPLGAVRHVPLERGEVVAGGVPLSEADPQTMQSLVMPGLYLCGEVLDIAGPVGGYNLQAAWSTGWVAGEAAARAL